MPVVNPWHIKREGRVSLQRIAWVLGSIFLIGCHSAHAEKAYPLGCSLQDPSFYNYEDFPFPPKTTSAFHQHNTPNDAIAIRDKGDFLITRRLGTGKFSDVFEAVDVSKCSSIASSSSSSSVSATIDPSTLVVLKCLKPVSDRKIRREVLVLKHVSQLPHLARILGVVLPDDEPAVATDHLKEDSRTTSTSSTSTRVPRMPTLVLAHAGPTSQWLCHNFLGKSGAAKHDKKGEATSTSSTTDSFLSDMEVRFFLLELLMSLDSLHSMGIMHRDVKPRNVLIQRAGGQTEERRLMLIDLGLADFYLPNQRYNVRVASRHYKSPELLVHYEYYDYALDLWGVGCILAGLLFHREPFFRGRDNVDQLAKIIKVLGTTDLIDYALRYKMKLPKDVQTLLEKCHAEGLVQRRPWTEFLLAAKKKRGAAIPSTTTSIGEELSDFEMQGMDLLDHLLVYDHDKRYTARQAMAHPFFDPVRKDI